MHMDMACVRGVRGVRVACAWRVHGISTCMAFIHAHAHAHAPAHADMRMHVQTATPSAVAHLEGWSRRSHTHLSYTDSERALHDLWMRRDANASGCIGNTSTKLKFCRTQARAWHRA